MASPPSSLPKNSFRGIRRESNPGPKEYKANALPLSHPPLVVVHWNDFSDKSDHQKQIHTARGCSKKSDEMMKTHSIHPS